MMLPQNQETPLKLLSQDQWTHEHKVLIDKHRESIRFLDDGSFSAALCATVVDVDSRFLASSDLYAQRTGFHKGQELDGRRYHELQFDGAEDAPLWEKADQDLLAQKNPDETTQCLSIYKSGNDMGGFFGSRPINILHAHRSLLVHPESASILGVCYAFAPFDSSHPRYALLVEYLVRFNLQGTLALSPFQDLMLTPSPNKLTPYQQEICFFTLLDWEPEWIAEFFQRNGSPWHREGHTVEEVAHARMAIAEKLGFAYDGEAQTMADFLVAQGIHRELPIALFAQPGSSALHAM